MLLVRMTLATGARPGPLNNATLADYQSAQTDKDKKIILVAKHKRSKDGPAILGMDEELQKLMRIYVTKIRPRVAVRDEKKLFVKDDGHGFPEGTIGKRLSSFWKMSGVRADKRMSHTDYRKCIATNTKKGTWGIRGGSKGPGTLEKEFREELCPSTGHSHRFQGNGHNRKCHFKVQVGKKEITKVTHSTAKASNAADDQSSDEGEELNPPSQETVPANPPSEENVPAEAASNPPSEENVPAEAASNPPSEENVPAEEVSI
ncbi:hypothetical protein ACROYT_G015438 [Oculina patagonica]